MRHPFSSDNCAPTTPEVMEALAAANAGHCTSYGDDALTARAADLVREFLGAPAADVLFVFTGTAANALALASLAPPYGIVACSEAAHVLVDECGAPGFFGAGLQLRPLPAPEGRIDAGDVDAFASLVDVHAGRPAAVSLTQSTELGTVYSLDDLARIGEVARGRGLRVHVDGARFGNAVASLGCTPRALLDALRPDVLVLGGTKNGLLGSEALVSFDPAVTAALHYRRKQSGQLASKHRFLAAQWLGALGSPSELRSTRSPEVASQEGVGARFLARAAHANGMASRLAAGFRARGSELAFPCEADAVFVRLDDGLAARLRALGYALFTEPSWRGALRLVCAWDTTAADVDAFLADLDEAAR